MMSAERSAWCVARRSASRAFAGADLRGGDRGQRRDDADAEQERGQIEVEAERAGGERARRQPAEHHEVGHRHHVDRDIGENDRPAQRKRRAELALEPARGGVALRFAARRA